MIIRDLSDKTQAYINSFKYHLQVEKGLTKNTITSYFSDLMDLFHYVEKEIDQLLSKDIISYFVNLQELGISSATIARKRSSIVTFYRFIKEEGVEVKLNLDSIPRIKYSQNLPDVLSIEEMIRLLDSIPVNSNLGKRNKAMLELMYASGLRISELINLSEHDISWEENVVRIMGKGNKQRVVPIAEKSMVFIRDYFQNARPALAKTRNTAIMFLNRSGNKLSRMGIWKILKNLALRSGLKKHISPHIIRHSFATHLIEAGANLRVVQMLLGHSSINTTQIYTNIDRNFIIKEHKLYHPRS